MILTHLILFGFFDGEGGTPPAVDTTVTPIAGSGGGHQQSYVHPYQVPQRDWKGDKERELRRLLEVLGEEPETAVKVAAIKAEHSNPPKGKRKAPTLDIRALLADMQAMQWLLNAYAAFEERRALEARLLLEIEEEDAFLLLM